MNRPSPASFTGARQEQHAETARPGPAKGAAARLRAGWSALAGVIGAVVGFGAACAAPHRPARRTALITGAGGTALFGVLGLVASVPLLLRLRRRFGTWWAPAIGLAVFAVMFSLSAFVIGPAIDSGGGPSGG